MAYWAKSKIWPLSQLKKKKTDSIRYTYIIFVLHNITILYNTMLTHLTQCTMKKVRCYFEGLGSRAME